MAHPLKSGTKAKKPKNNDNFLVANIAATNPRCSELSMLSVNSQENNKGVAIFGPGDQANSP